MESGVAIYYVSLVSAILFGVIGQIALKSGAVNSPTVVAQFARIVSIWASAEAVGIHLSLRPYIVLGPLLFLVMLVPFTINGLAVREAFFVSFLGKLGVGADPAFATGFLFFVMTLALALPGLAFILWEGTRRGGPATASDA